MADHLFPMPQPPVSEPAVARRTAARMQRVDRDQVLLQPNDMSQMTPMLDQLQERYGSLPAQYLVDGGFAHRDAIADAAVRGSLVYAPVSKPRDGARDPHAPRDGDAPEVAAWRVRMGTTEAKQIYKERAATAECVNAIGRNRGLSQFLVRGIPKCLAALTLFALAHNVMRAVELLGHGV